MSENTAKGESEFLKALGISEKDIKTVDTKEVTARKEKALVIIGGIAGFIYLGTEAYLARHFIHNFIFKKGSSFVFRFSKKNR